MKTKLYLQDSEVYNILGDKIIYQDSIGGITPSFNTFSEKLIKALIYIKKDNKNNLKKIYKKIFNKESDDIEYIYDKLINLINKNKKEKNKEGLYKIYDIIINLGIEQKKIEEFNVSDVLFSILTDFSKKKFLWYKLREKYPKKGNETFKEYKCRLKKIIYDLKYMYNLDDSIISDMSILGVDELFVKIAMTFSKSLEDPIFNLLNNLQVNEDNILTIIKYLEESNIPEKQIKNIKDEFFISNALKPNITAHIESKINGNNLKELQEIEKIPRKTIADFNPFLVPLDFGTGVKSLGYDRFLEIYNKVFYGISKDIINKTKGIIPSFNKLLKFNIDKLQNKESKETKHTYQYIIEFDINNFSLNKLKQLAILVNEEIGDINLISPIMNQQFKHPLLTIKGDTKYDGYFSDSGEGFADNNVIWLKGEKGEEKIRLTLSDFSQDEYIYLITQIGYFLKKGKFIDKSQLYFDIYNRYNQTLFNDNLFDITILENNYDNFVRNIILPLTKEGIKLGLKPSNILLAGPYGTSKSQFLKHILLKKKWKFKGKNFFLNANIIPIGLQEFKALLLQGLGGIKTRLDEIYQRTSAPIVLLVEDLDTLINEKAFGVNDELAQSMTLFFEGLGSLPVNVITTSNDPTKFSERLIRPNRISKILIFNRPTIEEKKKMLDEHIKNKNIYLEKNILNIIYNSSIFKNGTAAHISEIIKEINNYILSEKILSGNSIKLSEKIIKHILSNIPVSSKDLDEREEIILSWHKEISGKTRKIKMGFTDI